MYIYIYIYTYHDVQHYTTKYVYIYIYAVYELLLVVNVVSLFV